MDNLKEEGKEYGAGAGNSSTGPRGGDYAGPPGSSTYDRVPIPKATGTLSKVNSSGPYDDDKGASQMDKKKDINKEMAEQTSRKGDTGETRRESLSDDTTKGHYGVRNNEDEDTEGASTCYSMTMEEVLSSDKEDSEDQEDRRIGDSYRVKHSLAKGGTEESQHMPTGKGERETINNSPAYVTVLFRGNIGTTGCQQTQEGPRMTSTPITSTRNKSERQSSVTKPTEVRNPFAPGKHLQRSPPERLSTIPSERPMTPGTGGVHFNTSGEVRAPSPCKSKPTLRPIEQGEMVIRREDLIKALDSWEKIRKRVEETTKAVHEYASNTKNVKSLLKEWSATSLAGLAAMETKFANFRNMKPYIVPHGGQIPSPKKSERGVTIARNIAGSAGKMVYTGRKGYPEPCPPATIETGVPSRSTYSKRKTGSPLDKDAPQKKVCQETTKKTFVEVLKTQAEDVSEPEANFAEVRKRKNRSREDRENPLAQEPRIPPRIFHEKDNHLGTSMGRLGNGERTVRKGKGKNTPAVKPRSEALLIRVKEGSTYLGTYRDVLSKGKDLLVDTKAVRRTREGHVLIELAKKKRSRDMAEALRNALGDKSSVTALQSRTTLEIRNLDPLANKEDIADGFAKAMAMDVKDIRVRSIRMVPSGVQTALLDAPTHELPGDINNRRIRIGLSISYARPLPKVIRCFRCHALGHLSSTCKEVPVGKEQCRRCGASDHNIKECSREPFCTLCAAQGLQGINLKHVAASLGCPVYKRVVQRLRDEG